MCKPKPSSFLNYVTIGAELTCLESILIYISPIFHAFSPWLFTFYIQAGAQLALFLPFVIIPALVTKRMAYVDIGWPVGLILMALCTTLIGTGWPPRRFAAGACLLAHGGRMGLGALIYFFPYRFPDDLSRYQYAKRRWIYRSKMPEQKFSYKIAHDVCQQWFANASILVTPFLLTSNNVSPNINPIEIIAWISWLYCFFCEVRADVQKNLFLADCKKEAESLNCSDDKKNELKCAVVGFGNFASKRYSLWTTSRHPNYFFEWMSWSCFVLGPITCASYFIEDLPQRGAY